MIKRYIFLFCIFLIVLSLYVEAACLNSADDYAVEVLLNKPGIDVDFDAFKDAENIFQIGDSYVIKSNYGGNYGVIISKVSDGLCEECMSVRLQIPTESEEKNVNYLIIFLNSLSGELKNTGSYKDWITYCSSSQCVFQNENVEIVITKDSGKSNAVIEIVGNVFSCDACEAGTCLKGASGNFCVPETVENEIKDILEFSGLVNEDDKIFFSYQILSSGTRKVTNLVPSGIEANWKNALREELAFLKERGISGVSSLAISKISNLAKLGKAGHDSRIVYGENLKGDNWMYYYETKSPTILNEENCNSFSASSIPSKRVEFSKFYFPIYYTIPLFVTSSILVILLLLIVIGRFTSMRKDKVRKKLKE